MNCTGTWFGELILGRTTNTLVADIVEPFQLLLKTTPFLFDLKITPTFCTHHCINPKLSSLHRLKIPIIAECKQLISGYKVTIVQIDSALDLTRTMIE